MGKFSPEKKVTFEGDYSAGIERLATLLVNHYGSDHLFPVVSVGDYSASFFYQFWGEENFGKTSLDLRKMLKKNMFLD